MVDIPTNPVPASRVATPPAGFRGRTILRAGGWAGGVVVSAWILSAFYHLAIFVLMYLIPWLSGIIQERVDSPPFAAVVGDPDEPLVTLTASDDVTFESAENELKPPQFEPKPEEQFAQIRPRKASALSVLGLGVGGGPTNGFDLNLAAGDAGPEFFGLGGQARGARNIAYVVDRSGSMLTTLQGVKKELVESISKLRRTQKFHVIFFNTGAPLENPPRRMVNAIQAHKNDTFEFIEQITAGGGTDPRLAVRRAFAVEPDLVYLLTDGEFDPQLVDVLNQLNRNRRVRVFTIAYVSRAGADLLERIAREHNGEFRFVSEDDIF